MKVSIIQNLVYPIQYNLGLHWYSHFNFSKVKTRATPTLHVTQSSAPELPNYWTIFYGIQSDGKMRCVTQCSKAMTDEN